MTEETRRRERPAGVAVHLALGLVQVLFGTNAVVGKIALRSLSPLALLAARVPAAALLFLLLRALVARRVGWQALARRDLPLVGACALLGVTINQVLYFEGLHRTSAINAAVLGTTIPVFTAGFAILLGRERATAPRLLGLAVALGGALTVALGGRPDRAALGLHLATGELALIANSASYALYLVASRPLFQRYRTDTAITWIFVVGAITLLPFGGAALAAQLPAAPLAARAAIAFIILGPTIGAYFLNGYALRTAPATLVAVYIYAQPVIAAGVAAVILDERPMPATLVGAGLIGAGIALVAVRAR